MAYFNAYVKIKEQQRPKQNFQERTEIMAIEKTALILELRKQSTAHNRPLQAFKEI